MGSRLPTTYVHLPNATRPCTQRESEDDGHGGVFASPQVRHRMALPRGAPSHEACHAVRLRHQNSTP
jgi:hypothetical protein